MVGSAGKQTGYKDVQIATAVVPVPAKGNFLPRIIAPWAPKR
jgi:hypothetical protein